MLAVYFELLVANCFDVNFVRLEALHVEAPAHKFLSVSQIFNVRLDALHGKVFGMLGHVVQIIGKCNERIVIVAKWLAAAEHWLVDKCWSSCSGSGVWVVVSIGVIVGVGVVVR